MQFSLHHINYADIDAQDLSFVVSCGFDLARLRASIEELGLLTPPLLRPRPEGGYQIICGYQRVLVLAQLGWPELLALLVPEETPAAWCLQASLQDNLLGRGLNPMETAFMVERLTRYHPEEAVCRNYLPLLGLPPSRPATPKDAGPGGVGKPLAGAGGPWPSEPGGCGCPWPMAGSGPGGHPALV